MKGGQRMTSRKHADGYNEGKRKTQDLIDKKDS